MRQNPSPEMLDAPWRPGFPSQIPDKLVIPEELEGAGAYIRDFDRLAETSRTAQELYDKMLEL
jgi:hypothetical protein